MTERRSIEELKCLVGDSYALDSNPDETRVVLCAALDELHSLREEKEQYARKLFSSEPGDIFGVLKFELAAAQLANDQLREENAKLKETSPAVRHAFSKFKDTIKLVEALKISETLCRDLIAEKQAVVDDRDSILSELSILRAQLRPRKFPDERPGRHQDLFVNRGKGWFVGHSSLLRDGDIWLPQPPLPEEGK